MVAASVVWTKLSDVPETQSPPRKRSFTTNQQKSLANPTLPPDSPPVHIGFDTERPANTATPQERLASLATVSGEPARLSSICATALCDGPPPPTAQRHFSSTSCAHCAGDERSRYRGDSCDHGPQNPVSRFDFDPTWRKYPFTKRNFSVAPHPSPGRGLWATKPNNKRPRREPGSHRPRQTPPWKVTVRREQEDSVLCHVRRGKYFSPSPFPACMTRTASATAARCLDLGKPAERQAHGFLYRTTSDATACGR